MNNLNTYDVLIIGGGISACVFASSYLKKHTNEKIAIIEAGRSLGGRSSTRISNKNRGWQLNHGSPSFNFCNYQNDQLLRNFIKDLLEKKIIKNDDSELINLTKGKKIDLEKIEFYRGSNYVASSSMTELSWNIISLHNLRNQIDFYFKTLIVKLFYDKNHWTLISMNGEIFKSRFIVFSSNLLLHKRVLKILKSNKIPLRDAIPKKKNKIIDALLKFTNKQKYIPRLTFLIYTKSNYKYKDDYSKKFRYFYLDEDLEMTYNFERVIFQLQKNNNLGIVVHTRNIDFIKAYLREKNKDNFKKIILSSFNKLFEENTYINKLNDYENISIMHWRASQPLGVAVPKTLQFCNDYKIGFCGDWFEYEGFGRIEGAVLSALKLAENFNF